MKKVLLAIVMVLLSLGSYAQNGLESGYRGFLDFGWNMDEGGNGFDMTTVHGYQINNHLFVGAGATFHVNYNEVNFPLFANLRYDILDKPISPYLDLKVGGVAASGSGFYLSPGLGVRLPTSRRAMNFGVSYILRTGGPWETHDLFTITDHYILNGCCIRLGFEW